MKLPTHEMNPDKNALNGKVPTRQPRRFSFDFEYGDDDNGDTTDTTDFLRPNMFVQSGVNPDIDGSQHFSTRFSFDFENGDEDLEFTRRF